MIINPKVPGDRPLISIGHKCNSWKVLGFIATEGDGITYTGYFYLFCLPENYSNVSIHPVVVPRIIGTFFNACNAIYNNNRMRKSDLVIDKYKVTQSGHFRLATTLASVMVITDANILFCHSISEQRRYNKISMR